MTIYQKTSKKENTNALELTENLEENKIELEELLENQKTLLITTP